MQQKEQVMDQVRSQIAVAIAQELMQKMADKCFRKCINYPSAELDTKETKCLGMCMERYMESWNTVSRTYSARLQKDKGI